MEIVWLTPECILPVNSGGKNVMCNRIYRMAQRHNIHLFSIVDNNDEFKYLNELQRHCATVKLYTRRKSLKTYVKGMITPYPVESRNIEAMKQDIDYICITYKPDFIVVEFPQMLINLSDYVLENYTVILNQHNIEHMALESISSKVKSPIKKVAYKIVAKQMRRFEKKMYESGKINYFSFVSLSDKKYFETTYSRECTTYFPIGTDISVIDNNIEKDNSIIFVGKMSYEPNDYAVKWFIDEVWDKIKKSNEQVTLKIVGKEPSVELQERALRHKDIIITGKVDSVEEYYQKALIVVIPIFSGGGVKVKLIEALGRGSIVITTTKGIEGTALVPNTHVLIANDANEFAVKCDEVISNYSSYESMRENIFKVVSDNYSWESIIDKYESELMNLKGEKG